MIEFIDGECFLWWQSESEPGVKYRLALCRFVELATSPPPRGKTFPARCSEAAERLEMTPDDLEEVRLGWRDGDSAPPQTASA